MYRLICNSSVIFCISNVLFLIGETYVKEYRVCVMLGYMKIQKIISRMEKSGSTIMHAVQQSLFHKHAELFDLYGTSHSSQFLTLTGIVYVRRKNVSVNSKIVTVHPYRFDIMLHLALCFFVRGPTSKQYFAVFCAGFCYADAIKCLLFEP